MAFKLEQEQRLICSNVSYDEEQQHSVTGYPWLADPDSLPNNSESAMATLKSTERALAKDSAWAMSYKEQIEERNDRGAARKLSAQDTKDCCSLTCAPGQCMWSRCSTPVLSSWPCHDLLALEAGVTRFSVTTGHNWSALSTASPCGEGKATVEQCEIPTLNKKNQVCDICGLYPSKVNPPVFRDHKREPKK